MIKLCLIMVMLCVFLGGNLNAQTTIIGVVTDFKDVPIPYSTIYLSKTAFCVSANNKGFYTLTIPQTGTYELISSCVGYETHSQIIKADGSDLKINIHLPERIVILKEVSVKGKDLNRIPNYNLFISCFIGKTTNAPYCTIKNSKDLVVYRDSQDSNLIAYSVKPLVILNSSLGYKITYDLRHFKYNLYTKHLSFYGNYYFEDISNQKWRNSRTNRNRLSAYYGSRTHFLRALFSDSLSQENFEVCDIGLDSCGDKVLTNSIQGSELRLACNQDSMAIYHFNPLFISYYDYHPELFINLGYRPGQYTSTIVFSDTLQIYKNGYYPDAYNLSWSGKMAKDRIAEMLPYDFVPKVMGKYAQQPGKEK